MSPMRLDMHNHFKVAKRMPFRLRDAEQFAKTLLRRGLHGGAVTEHFHARNFWGMHDALAARFDYVDGRFDIDGALFFTGAELSLAEKVDVLIIAPLEELKRIDSAFESPLSGGYHPTGAEFAEVCEAERFDCVRIGAHPMRSGKSILKLDATVASRVVDAVEINARFAFNDETSVRAYAARRNLPLTGGSDAHVWLQAGAAWTEFDSRIGSYDALKQAILSGRGRAVVHHEAVDMCESGAEWKAALKAAHYAPPAGAMDPDEFESASA